MADILEGFPSEGRVVVDGYLVPCLAAATMADGSIRLTLDCRLEIIVRGECLDQWLWFVANAMAIGAGYSCFGEHSVPVHPYRVRYTGIEAPSDPVVSVGGEQGPQA